MYHDTILFTDDVETTRQDVNSHGGSVVFNFGGGVVVARLPELVDPASLRNSRIQAPVSLDERSRFLIDAWNLSRSIKPDEDKTPLILPEGGCVGQSGAQPRSAEL